MKITLTHLTLLMHSELICSGQDFICVRACAHACAPVQKAPSSVLYFLLKGIIMLIGNLLIKRNNCNLEVPSGFYKVRAEPFHHLRVWGEIYTCWLPSYHSSQSRLKPSSYQSTRRDASISEWLLGLEKELQIQFIRVVAHITSLLLVICS